MCSCKQAESSTTDKRSNFDGDKTYFYYKCKYCKNLIPHHELIQKDYSIEKEIKEVIAKGKYEDYYVTGVYKSN